MDNGERDAFMANRIDILVTRLNRTFPVKLIIHLGMIIGRLLPIRNPSRVFCLFPFCHVGGAEQVHADIVRCLEDKKPWVIFTKRSDNEKFRPLFRGARTFNLWYLCKYGYPFSIGMLAGFINRHRDAVVFGSNSLVYYLLLPYLRPEIRTVDLIHAFGAGIEEYSLPTVPLLDRRVVITSATRDDLRRLYRERGLPEELDERITLITNRVTVPECFPEKAHGERLSLLYVGRGSAEKRVHLIGRLATMCRVRALPVDVVLVGDVVDEVAPDDCAACILAGEVADRQEMVRYYTAADLLLLTSSREGFPLVIMEAMAHGVVPVSTAVGGISEQVVDGVTGWLVEDGDEERIVSRMCDIIERMCVDRARLAVMSRAAFDHARHTFGGERFCTEWRRMLSREG
jgi:glycosyltransferase involved in cell wall biosynthesis